MIISVTNSGLFVKFVVLNHIEKRNLPAVVLGTHGEVQPVAAGIALHEQLVEVLMHLVADVEQQHHIPQQLLLAHDPQVGGTPREVVRRGASTHQPVQLLAAESAVDDHRVVALAILFVPALAQHLQPLAHPRQVLCYLLIRLRLPLAVHISQLHVRARHLLKRKMRR